MKAKDYYDKYIDTIFVDLESASNLFMEFNKDMRETCEKRHAKRDEAVVAVMAEQNDKWNALVRLFEKNSEQKRSPIKLDAFIRFWIRQMPQVEELWMQRRKVKKNG